MPILIALSFLLCPLAFGQAPDSQPADVIRATGIGRPPEGKSPAQARLMARRAAEVVALRNLVRKLHDDEVVGDDGTFTATTEGFVRGFNYLPPSEHPDGTVEVVVELPLRQAYQNHVTTADRVAFLEAELARTRAELDELRSLHERTRQWLATHAAAMERELEHVRSLLDEPPNGAPPGP
jgi:hypothetical protein